MNLALDKKIELDLDDVAQTNHAAVMIQSVGRLPATGNLILFGSLEPILIYSSPEALQNNDFQTIFSKEEEKQMDDADEGLTLGIRKVDVDTNPFSEAESLVVDAKFYTRNDDVSEVISTKVPMAHTYNLEQRTITTKKSNEGDALNGRGNDEPMIQVKSEVSANERMTIPQEKVSKPLIL
ncbi:ty3-gypsy retrotransposon protein [Cucumis melo var. makuwa]|uniref:Ty3-gypsy retrotransposon protein n=1 Tax=Cucumis melo var. makuwa TaxID=1194695 RepID=A0A5A7UP85_CUCMM|nr:ty3-gypsy retrotransposon protein [Cucumis melo var. makuwa]TYJ97448.1 ty3-gypsy retrotransposon protein [Cucumis melo var. makuwa]